MNQHTHCGCVSVQLDPPPPPALQTRQKNSILCVRCIYCLQATGKNMTHIQNRRCFDVSREGHESSLSLVGATFSTHQYECTYITSTINRIPVMVQYSSSVVSQRALPARRHTPLSLSLFLAFAFACRSRSGGRARKILHVFGEQPPPPRRHGSNPFERIYCIDAARLVSRVFFAR
ncbi:unnamed protein product, partial [Ectocarpus fasciculatus]